MTSITKHESFLRWGVWEIRIADRIVAYYQRTGGSHVGAAARKPLQIVYFHLKRKLHSFYAQWPLS